MNIEQAIASVTGAAVVDLTKITSLVESIVAAAPAITEGVIDISTYVNAIATMVKNGGTPSDAEWAALKASLDVGSQTLASAAADAENQPGEAAAPNTTE